ncbi:hypothetical protein ABD89_18405 [Lysinibacillus sphaericus]|nr:hypothetical protein [Lysinibacillus sphaericus]
MPSFGVRTPLTEKYFNGFVEAYDSEDSTKVQDERWNLFTREAIAAKGDILDIGLIADESLSAYDNLPDPIESAEEAINKLQQAMELLGEVVTDLKAIEVKDRE